MGTLAGTAPAGEHDQVATACDDAVGQVELANEAIKASEVDAAVAHLSAAIRGFTAAGDLAPPVCPLLRASLLLDLVRLHDQAGNRAKAFGLGGRSRRASSASERARLNVTRALRTATAKLSEALPEAGRRLDRRLRTGLYCAYEPAPGRGRCSTTHGVQPGPITFRSP